MSKISEALDLTEQLLDGTEHVLNMLELLGVAFYNDHNNCKDCEISSVYIVDRFIEREIKPKLEELCDIIESFQ